MRNRYVTWGLGVLTIVLIALALWSMGSRAYSAENLLEANYQKGFFNLVDDVNTLNILLSKSLVTSSDSQRIIILTSIWHEAENARSNLASLPLGSRDMTNLQKFFAQMGDFSHTLAKKVSLGEQISDKEWDTLEQFKKNTQNLSRRLRELQDSVATGRIRWESGSFAPGLSKRIEPGLADRFAAIDQRLKEEAPSITYDGPFSDHVEEITPKAITGSAVNEQQAIEKGKKFIDNPANVRYDVSVYSRTRGTVNAYSLKFTRPGADGAEIVMDVSRQGGHVIWFLNTRDIGEQKIDIKTAVDKARKFLEARGYANMEPTGSLREDNSLTVTFAYKQGDVLVYPDFVKVEVALDDGQVVGFDAMGYLTHHTMRKIPSPGISEKHVRDSLNKSLEVRRIRKVIIPDPALKERFCYEVDANLDDERYLIYINAQNGREEQILKVVETENGTMTM
ncbi:germination protein YpeB [Thermosediminibacter oceani DSM 16646]|uniref:Germination protein YpeB n=1 Tax=Thermosediminibacter oceani (strain ATCC BAA-1034 / DSM 16646 / JW/IW-1228P) TaxID=555079 RepID=D9S297_THEOJ|nr:germination protein YpeB [Thermosediminibacter oceani DSM 16646]